MILEAFSVAVPLMAGLEYWRSRRGPLVLLALAVMHARASLVTARWVAGQVPGLWRVAYPQAVEWVRKNDMTISNVKQARADHWPT
jgi:hypothetical protein